MIRFLFRLVVRCTAAPQSAASTVAEDWRRDPLSHPVIRRMTERERADLPFSPQTVLPD